MIFDGAIEAWRNVKYDAAELRIEKRISERSVPIVGGIWQSLKMGVNYASAIVRVPAALVFGASDKKPEAPEIPETLGKELGENLKTAFNQECEVAKAKSEGWKSCSRLNIVEGKQHFSNAEHVAARASEVTLPEEKSGGNGLAAAAASGAALLGTLDSPQIRDQLQQLTSKVALA